MEHNRRLRVLSVTTVLIFIFITLFIASAAVAKDSPNPKSKNPNVTWQTVPITMQMEAGKAFSQDWWTGDGRLMHSGIGWITPFGRASYVAVRSSSDAEQYKPDYMLDDSWSNIFSTGLFCVYRLEDGDIYAFDGIMGNVEVNENSDGKMDYLLNIIVGGTGRYKGATGILLGRTPGRVDISGSTAPETLMKIMEGYIKIAVKESKHKTCLPSIGTQNPQKWPEALAYFDEGKLVPINIEMEAGRAQWNPWGSGTTIIAGMGWMEPFGRAEYHYGYGYSEASDTEGEGVKRDFMSDASWSTPYPTNNLCIYHLENGDIYAYDGIVGNLVPDSDDGKVDYIVEVIVGGTDDYSGATGMILGYTFGRGEAAVPTYGDEEAPYPLPESIIKIMKGYVIKKEIVAAEE